MRWRRGASTSAWAVPPAGDMRTAMALNPNAAHAAEQFPEQITDVIAWTRGARHRGLAAHPLPPADAEPPELWVLGSSDYGARLAAHLGLPYAFAYFFTDGQGCEEALSLYRALYRPSARHPQPAGDDLHLGPGGRYRRRGTPPRTVARALAGGPAARADAGIARPPDEVARTRLRAR